MHKNTLFLKLSLETHKDVQKEYFNSNINQCVINYVEGRKSLSYFERFYSFLNDLNLKAEYLSVLLFSTLGVELGIS